MNRKDIQELIDQQKERFERQYNSFVVGDIATLENFNDDTPYLEEGTTGTVIDKTFNEYGCSIRVDFNGTELWIDAEDLYQ